MYGWKFEYTIINDYSEESKEKFKIPENIRGKLEVFYRNVCFI